MSMTRRAREQEEETMTQHLSARGLLEPGMTYTDKKDLMSILRESENMAVEKTEATDVEDMQVELDCKSDGCCSHSDEKNTADAKEEIVVGKDRNQSPNKLYCGRSSLSDSSPMSVNKSEVSPSKSSSPENVIRVVPTEKEEVAEAREEECDKTDPPQVTADMVSTENMELDIESTKNTEPSKSDDSDVDMFPESPELLVTTKQEASKKGCLITLKKNTNFVKNSTFPGNKHTVKDDGNINVFDDTCSSCKSKVTLQRKCIEAQEKFPFFFLQRGITLDAFIGHFKKYVDCYRRNLLHIQRSSVNLLEWGRPIPITFLKSSAVVGELKKTDLSKQVSSNSYNFRERTVKNKDPYSLSDSENFIDDSAVGVCPSETYVQNSSDSESDEIISRRDKRKSDQKEDHEWKQSSDSGRPSVSKRIKFSLSKADLKNTEAVDSDEDFAPTNSRRTYKRGGRRGAGRGRGTKVVEAAKPLSRKQPSNRGKSKAVKALVSVMEDCEDSAPTESCSQKSEEFELRLQQPSTEPASQENIHSCSSPESKPSSQEFSCRNSAEKGTKENSDSSDITFLGSTPSKAVQDQRSKSVVCPICGNRFTSEEIEIHASTCDLYPSDRSQHEDPDI